MNKAESQPMVLVVDDETHILHIVSLKLRNAGYTVETALDGEEAYAIALEREPDLVITDFQMPYMTGLELCRRLRQDAVTAETPVLMLTARGFNLHHEDLSQTNIVGVLSKPFSPREVLAKVNQLVRPQAVGDA
ncbi:MAG: response regulator [Planctomycetota bacterium]|jgi:DNA-binding response OmpR family regulator